VRRLLLLGLALVLAVGLITLLPSILRPHEGAGEELPVQPVLTDMGVASRVEIRIIYDNYPYDQSLETALGFSCYLNVDGVGLLFDTGGSAEILLGNMAKLHINAEDIQIVVISHIHEDHVGGLLGFLSVNPNVKVYLPESFPESLKDEVRGCGAEVIEVKGATRICHGVATTGEMGSTIREQSLLVATQKGLLVITGCAHPGVVNIVKTAIGLTGMDVYLVLGGFHLAGAPASAVSSVIDELRELGVVKVAPCHCSGDHTRQLALEKFGDNYVEVGVGWGTTITAGGDPY